MCMTPLASAGQKSLADVAAKPDKVAKKIWFRPAHADLKKLHDIGMPKKVGLITFYIFDPSTPNKNSMGSTYVAEYSRIMGGIEKQASVYATPLASIAVPILKRDFGARGMEILTPIEFLDTEDKLRAYVDFELPKGGLEKATAATVAWVSQTTDVAGAADGYRMFPLHSSFLNKKVMISLEELRQTLELDALIAVTNLTQSSKKGLMLTGAQMQVFGKNPVPLPENKLQAKFWQPTIPYTSATYGKGFKGATIGSREGYDVLVEALSKRTLAELQKYYDKGR